MTDQSSFVEKFRVVKYKDLVGQESAIREVESFLKEFPKKKALLLYGPPGTGKTSLALAAALEHDLDIFELNASDLRNRLKLEEILKPASMQQSLFKKGRVLLMDEVDGVTGTDIGGVPELIRIIDKTAHPMIITGNDVWQTKFSDLRRTCKLVEMKALATDTVVQILQGAMAKTNKQENVHFLKQIAIKSQGDVRAALNDLQIYSIGKPENLDYLDRRDREESIFNILKLLFQQRGDFLDLFDNTDMSLDEVFLWIEENIPREYQGEELYKAFMALSAADLFRGRIYMHQSWRFLLYQNAFQSAGVAYAKHKPKIGFIKYERPSRILKIWLNNQKTAKKKTIAQKYAKYVHCSVKRAMRDFDLIKKYLQSPQIQEELKLTGEEIDFLRK